eukprot:113142-Pelagomonas_calceolata.AAC.2
MAVAPKLKSPDRMFCSASMPSFRAGGALGRPCWPSSAQLPNKEGGGCAGWASVAGVIITGKQANLGAHAP